MKAFVLRMRIQIFAPILQTLASLSRKVCSSKGRSESDDSGAVDTFDVAYELYSFLGFELQFGCDANLFVVECGQ